MTKNRSGQNTTADNKGSFPLVRIIAPTHAAYPIEKIIKVRPELISLAVATMPDTHKAHETQSKIAMLHTSEADRDLASSFPSLREL